MADATTPTTTAGKVVITPQELATSAATTRSELLRMPLMAMADTLNYFTLRPGIRHSETVGELSGEFEIGPYDPYRKDRDDIKITGRTLYTYLGAVVKEFEPNSVYQSIYGSSIVKGEGLANVPIAQQVLSFMAAKLGQSLAMHLFDAVRNDSGTRTVDLFNGADTVAAKEIAAGSVAESKGNLYKFGEVIDSTNAVDLVVDFCRSADDRLLDTPDGGDSRGTGLNLYVPRSIVYAYRDDYKATTGHSPIYDKFNQTTIEGFPNIRLVPFAGKKSSDIIQLTTKKNMLVGCDQTPGSLENITVEKHHAFLLDFIATLFFGFDYESISKERILFGQLKAKETTPPATGGGTGGGNNDDDE